MPGGLDIYFAPQPRTPSRLDIYLTILARLERLSGVPQALLER